MKLKQKIKHIDIKTIQPKNWKVYLYRIKQINPIKLLLKTPPLIGFGLVILFLILLFHSWGGAQLESIVINEQNVKQIINNWALAEQGFKQLILMLLGYNFVTMFWVTLQRKPQGKLKGS